MGRAARSLGCSLGYLVWGCRGWASSTNVIFPQLVPLVGVSVPCRGAGQWWLSMKPSQPTHPGLCWRDRHIHLCPVPVPAGLQELPRASLGSCLNTGRSALLEQFLHQDGYWCPATAGALWSPSLVLHLFSMWICMYFRRERWKIMMKSTKFLRWTLNMLQFDHFVFIWHLQ